MLCHERLIQGCRLGTEIDLAVVEVYFSMFRLIAEVFGPTRERQQGSLASNLLPVLFMAVIQAMWDFHVGPLGESPKRPPQ